MWTNVHRPSLRQVEQRVGKPQSRSETQETGGASTEGKMVKTPSFTTRHYCFKRDISGRCSTHISLSNTSERNKESRFCVRSICYDPSAEVSQLRDTVSALQQRLEEALLGMAETRQGSYQAAESEVCTDSSGIHSSRCTRWSLGYWSEGWGGWDPGHRRKSCASLPITRR